MFTYLLLFVGWFLQLYFFSKNQNENKLWHNARSLLLFLNVFLFCFCAILLFLLMQIKWKSLLGFFSMLYSSIFKLKKNYERNRLNLKTSLGVSPSVFLEHQFLRDATLGRANTMNALWGAKRVCLVFSIFFNHRKWWVVFFTFFFVFDDVIVFGYNENIYFCLIEFVLISR